MTSMPKLPSMPNWNLYGIKLTPKLPKPPDPRQVMRRTAKYYGVAQGGFGKWAQKVNPTQSNGGKV